MAVTKVPNHAHCVICRRAVPYGDQVCGQECQDQLDDDNTRRKRMMYFTYGLLGVGFLLLIGGQFLTG